MKTPDFENCISACAACAAQCMQCAAECLRESHPEHLVRCIEMDFACAAICGAATQVLSLRNDFSVDLCRVCADACTACAEECQKHAQMGMEHCRICAEACRNCASECEKMVAAA